MFKSFDSRLCLIFISILQGLFLYSSFSLNLTEGMRCLFGEMNFHVLAIVCSLHYTIVMRMNCGCKAVICIICKVIISSQIDVDGPVLGIAFLHACANIQFLC